MPRGHPPRVSKDRPVFLWEDDTVACFSKPPWWHCHVSKAPKTVKESICAIGTPSQKTKTLVQSGKIEDVDDFFEACYPDDTAEPRGSVYDLDVLTSGVVICAKNRKTYNSLRRDVADCRILRQYVCLVHGECEKDEGSIYVPIRKRCHDGSTKMIDARTDYRVLKSFTVPDIAGGKEIKKFTLLRCWMCVSLNYQVRTHMNSIGHTLVCDPKYLDIKQYQADRVWCPRLFLHHESIEFGKLNPEDTRNTQPLKIQCPLFADLEKTLNELTARMEGNITRAPPTYAQTTKSRWGNPLLPPPKHNFSGSCSGGSSDDSSSSGTSVADEMEMWKNYVDDKQGIDTEDAFLVEQQRLLDEAQKGRKSAECLAEAKRVNAQEHKIAETFMMDQQKLLENAHKENAHKGAIYLAEHADDSLISLLVHMGFDVESAGQALKRCDNNLDEALELLLSEQSEQTEARSVLDAAADCTAILEFSGGISDNWADFVLPPPPSKPPPCPQLSAPDIEPDSIPSHTLDPRHNRDPYDSERSMSPDPGIPEPINSRPPGFPDPEREPGYENLLWLQKSSPKHSSFMKMFASVRQKASEQSSSSDLPDSPKSPDHLIHDITRFAFET